MKKVIAVLLAVVLIFSLAGCGSKDGLTTNKVLKIAEKIEKGKEIDKSDFDGYECEESENVYKTYTYTIDDQTSVIITTDKKTGETLGVYLFQGSKYINIKEGKEKVKAWLEENAKSVEVKESK